MTYMDTTEIQSGWMVCANDGKEIGTVAGTDATTIQVKKSGMLGGMLTIPRDAVADIETGRVELSMTKEEAEAAGKH